MLIPIAPSMSLHGTVSLGGYLAGNADVENLQRALTNLATATQRPAINPGPVTGTVTDATMTAVQSAIGLLSEQLPTWAYLGLQAALAAGAMTSTAKTFVQTYATQLTVAANTAAVKYKVATPATATTTTALTPWYKTPAGIALLIIGGLVAYKVLLK